MESIKLDRRYVYSASGLIARILAIDIPGAKPVISCDHFGNIFRHDSYGHGPVGSNTDLIPVKKYPNLKKGDKVLVRDFLNSDWKKRHYSHEDISEGVWCFKDGKTEWTADGDLGKWNFVKPADDEISV